MRLSFFFILLFAIVHIGYAQDSSARIQVLEQKIDSAVNKGIPLNEQVTISMNGTLTELVTFLSETTSINLSIDPSLKTTISSTFTDTPVKDILLYLCDVHQLDLKFIGSSIIQIVKFKKPEEVIPAKKLAISYEEEGQLLTLDLDKDTLSKVTQQMATFTNQNIAIDPAIRDVAVSGFIKEATLPVVMRQLAANNNLLLKEEEGFFFLSEIVTAAEGQGKGRQAKAPSVNVADLLVKKVGNDRVSLNALNVSVLDVIKETARQTKSNYMILSESGKVIARTGQNNERNNRNNNDSRQTGSSSGDPTISLQLDDVSFEEILEQLCQNSPYTYSKDQDLFIVGKRTAEGLRMTKILQLQYRSAKGVIEFIPQDMLQGVEVDTLLELNSLILSGSEKNIVEVDSFLKSIDKLVPVVMIELIIVDVNKDMMREIGVEAGVVKGGVPPGGTVSGEGGTGFTFSPTAINRILRLLSGQNILNLGQVNNDFYVNLQAVEEKGYITVKSTPKLSTLNSHNATLSIGQKRYYQEQSVNFSGAQNPIVAEAINYKEVEANLFIDIVPIVSGDEQVTLEIQFEQSEFNGNPAPNEPPPQVSRKFNSIVRAKNGEMIVLGGLERAAKTDVKRGVPGLSRIPLIGWLFGKKRKRTTENKLVVFVRPTIIK